MSNIIRLSDRQNPSKVNNTHFYDPDFIDEAIEALEKAGYEVFCVESPMSYMLKKPVNRNIRFSH
jgi:hypothetical protein